MHKQPQTIAEELNEAFNRLLRESDRFRAWDAPEIQGLIEEARKLQKVDARQAFCLMGSVAAICGRLDEINEFYRKALALTDIPVTNHSHWIALANAGLYGSASGLGSWLLDPKRGFFPQIWRRAVSRGHILEVWDRLPEAKRTFPELSEEEFSDVADAAAVMRERGLSDAHLIAVLDVMGDVQRAHGSMFAGQYVGKFRVVRPPEEAPYLYMTIDISRGVEDVHAMNRELARRVVESLPNGAFPQGLVTAFQKAAPEALPAAA
jgi:hypothetical protein